MAALSAPFRRLGLCVLFWLVGFAATFFPLFFIKIYPYAQAQSWPSSNCTVISGQLSTDCGFFSVGFGCGAACQTFRFGIASTRPVFTVSYPFNSTYTIRNATAFVNLYGAVGVGGYYTYDAAVEQYNIFSNTSASYRCWYNPSNPYVVSLVNGYDACMIATIVGIGIGDGIGGLLFIAFLLVMIYRAVKSMYTSALEKIV